MERYDIVDDSGLRVVVDWVNPTSRGIEAWVEIRWQGNVPSPKLLAFGRYDLMGARTASSLASEAKARMPRAQVDWAELIGNALYRVIEQHRDGGQPVSLANVPAQVGAKWLLRPLIGTAGASSLIGAGGSLKSLLALACASSVASNRAGYLGISPNRHGPVLYLDWEADADTHAERLKALAAGVGEDPPANVLYRAEASPLARSVQSVSRIVQQEGVVLLIVDSVMLARGGDAFGPEDTVRLYAALREIGVPSLLIDHKSKAGKRGEQSGAYGSVVNENSARLQWDITGLEVADDHVTMRLHQHKMNNVGRLDDVAFRADFVSGDHDRLESVSFSPVAAGSVVPLGDSQADKVRSVLGQTTAGLTRKEIRELTGIQDSSLGQVLKRMRDSGVVMVDDEGAYHVG